jgi:hypothetical protein
MAKPKTAVERIVSAKKLIALIKESTNVRSKTAEISGVFGERVKVAIDDGYLHRQAFGVVAKMHRMEELKREAFIRQLWLYVDICRKEGLFGAQHTGDLDEMSRNDDAEERDEEPVDDEAAKAASDAARVAHASGIKPLKPRPPRRGALDGADAPSGTRIQ